MDTIVVTDGAFDFKDDLIDSFYAPEYGYDNNGSLTYDANKGVSWINYDQWGNPIRVQFTDHSITEHVYAADGRRLKTIHRTSIPQSPSLGIGVTASLTSSQTQAIDSLDYVGNFIYEKGVLKRYMFDDGYLKLYTNTFSPRFFIKDHLGNNRIVTDGSGNIQQNTNYYPYGGMTSISTGQGEQQFKYNGKEYDPMHGLNEYDYGARQYDPAIGKFTTMDPLCEKYYHISPYAYCAGNPVNAVDPDGRNPIYDKNGIFLGTDDLGLQGLYYVMDEKKFTQGMSHFVVEKYGIIEGIPNDIKEKINRHYKELPKRPDYDGYLTLEEANDWYRKGTGEPIFVSLEKIDLSGILSLGEDFVGQVKTFNLLINSGSLNDGLVFGSITLKRYSNHSVRAYSDNYGFEMHNPLNPLNWPRNIETIIGKSVAGNGKPFEINIYGSKKLTPILPWIK